MTIYRKSWLYLDDCDKGSYTSLINWDGCSPDKKESLIKEFKLDDDMGCQVAGYQPKKEVEQKYWYTNYDKVVDTAAHLIGWIGYPLFVYFILWGILMANGLPIAAAIFTVAVCVIPAVIASVLVGGILGLCACLISETVHGVVLNKRAKKQAKQDEFDSFIKGCRK